MPTVLKDVKRTSQKEDDHNSEAKDVDLKEFLGVPVYELTNRDEKTHFALSVKLTYPDWGLDEYDRRSA